MTPVEALVKSGLVVSHSEARRVIESGGFRIGEDKIPVSDINARVDDEVIWCGQKKGSVKLDLETLFAEEVQNVGS